MSGCRGAFDCPLLVLVAVAVLLALVPWLSYSLRLRLSLVVVAMVVAVVVGASVFTELKSVLPKTVAHLNANFFRICVCE